MTIPETCQLASSHDAAVEPAARVRFGHVPRPGCGKALRAIKIRDTTVGTRIELVSQNAGCVVGRACVNGAVRVRTTTRAGRVINRLGERVRGLKLQSMRHTSVYRHLQRVVRGLRIRPVQRKESGLNSLHRRSQQGIVGCVRGDNVPGHRINDRSRQGRNLGLVDPCEAIQPHSARADIRNL